MAGDPQGVDPGRVRPDQRPFCLGFRFLQETDDTPRVIEANDSERRGLLTLNRQGGDRYLGLRFHVRAEHPLKVHAVELVAREDQHMIDARPLDRAQVLPDGIGRPLVPFFSFIRLLRRENLDESHGRTGRI